MPEMGLSGLEGGARFKPSSLPLSLFRSEALYLRDPDGNGVELYWDRPKEQWPRTPAGELAMVTEPLDLRALLKEAPEAKVDAST